jgi:hypothetical protein
MDWPPASVGGQFVSKRGGTNKGQILNFVPARRWAAIVVSLAQIVFVAFPPMSALAVPPVTVAARLISVGVAPEHFDGVTTVGTEVPLVVFALFHVIEKAVPVELIVTVPPPFVVVK